jgi:hypothetical protein
MAIELKSVLSSPNIDEAYFKSDSPDKRINRILINSKNFINRGQTISWLNNSLTSAITPTVAFSFILTIEL